MKMFDSIIIRALISTLLFLFYSELVFSQNPGKKWMRYKTPEQAGWSSEKLLNICINSNAASMMLVYKGKVVYTFGDYCRRLKLHSARKSLLSALYGIYIERGDIILSKTLRELNITDKTPLTEQEKEAQIIDLLKSRSGVYLPAGQETESMRRERPQRGSHMHNTFWYYNNWDFNVLGTIFKQETKKDIFETFFSKIAKPLQMEDFRLIDGTYNYELQYSNHPAYAFKMSCRDIARFGQLYLHNGKWDDKQIIPENWIKQSTTSYSKTYSDNTTYGYLWWINENFYNTKMFYAAGYGGQRIYVFPTLDIVVAINADTYMGNSVSDVDYVITDIIKNAKPFPPISNPEFIPLEEPEQIITVEPDNEFLKKYIGKYHIGDTTLSITQINGDLVLVGLQDDYKFKLLPISKDSFRIEDIDMFLFFESDKYDKPINIELHKSIMEAKLYHLIVEKGIQEAIKQFPYYKSKIGNKEELRFLSSILEFRGIETLEIKKLNASIFPYSYRVQEELKNELLKKSDLKTAENVFGDLYDAVRTKELKNTKTEWFYKIITANASNIFPDEKEQLKYIGDYGPRHIVKEDGKLYYFYGNNGTKYKLLKIDTNTFALENIYYVYIKFSENDKGEVTKIISCYYRDSFEENPKNK